MSFTNVAAAALGAALFGAGIYVGAQLLAPHAAPIAPPPNARPPPAAQAAPPRRYVAHREPSPSERKEAAAMADHALFKADSEAVCTWLSEIGCSPATVAHFRNKSIDGPELFTFIERDNYGFLPEDKLVWFGVSERDDVVLVAQKLLELTAPSS
eukprot:m.248325 g.248325  ORF g.248325 m.248325 type:complete len:155 (-) comp15700_c0_seq1:45-509(-)